MFNVDVTPPVPGTAVEKLKSSKTLYKWGQQNVGIYRSYNNLECQLSGGINWMQ